MVKGKRILALIVMMAMVLTVATPSNFAQEGTKKEHKIIAYLPTWETKQWDVDDIKGDELTHIYLSFARIDNNFEISDKEVRIQIQVGDKRVALPDIVSSQMVVKDTWEKIKQLQEKYPKLKVIIAVGGWEAEGFSDMAATPITREIFADSVVRYVKEHNLAGIDLDWEYPVNGGWGVIETRPEDKDNFTELIKILREKLGPDKEITFCAAGGGWFLDVVDFEKVVPLVNGVNLMAYDYEGGWSDKAAHHTNLYSNPKGGMSTDLATQNLIKKGVPSQKLTIGAAAYGREFKNVAAGPNKDGLFQKFVTEDKLTWRDGIIPYTYLKNYYIEKNGFKRYWDDVAKAPYLYDGKTFISYDDEQSISEKCDYIKAKNLQGIMYWEYVDDINGDLLNTMHNGLK